MNFTVDKIRGKLYCLIEMWDKPILFCQFTVQRSKDLPLSERSGFVPYLPLGGLILGLFLLSCGGLSVEQNEIGFKGKVKVQNKERQNATIRVHYVLDGQYIIGGVTDKDGDYEVIKLITPSSPSEEDKLKNGLKYDIYVYLDFAQNDSLPSASNSGTIFLGEVKKIDFNIDPD